jgi:hypothetical protein
VYQRAIAATDWTKSISSSAQRLREAAIVAGRERMAGRSFFDPCGYVAQKFGSPRQEMHTRRCDPGARGPEPHYLRLRGVCAIRQRREVVMATRLLCLGTPHAALWKTAE